MSKQVPNRRCGWSQLVSGGVAGEQVSFQVSSESVDRWRYSNGEWQTVPDARSSWAEGAAAGEHCVVCRYLHEIELHSIRCKFLVQVSVTPISNQLKISATPASNITLFLWHQTNSMLQYLKTEHIQNMTNLLLGAQQQRPHSVQTHHW